MKSRSDCCGTKVGEGTKETKRGKGGEGGREEGDRKGRIGGNN